MDLTRKGEIDKEKGKGDGKIESTTWWRRSFTCWEMHCARRSSLAEWTSCRYRYRTRATVEHRYPNRSCCPCRYRYRTRATVEHRYPNTSYIIIIIIRHSMSSDYVGLYTHGQSCLNEVRRINLVLVYCVCDCWRSDRWSLAMKARLARATFHCKRPVEIQLD